MPNSATDVPVVAAAGSASGFGIPGTAADIARDPIFTVVVLFLVAQVTRPVLERAPQL